MSFKERLIFTRFASDMISYALKEKGLEWDMPESPQKFDFKIGDAVLCYRYRHHQEFLKMFNHAEWIFVDEDSISQYIDINMDKIFGEDDVFLLQVVKVCAFIVDLAIQCYSHADKDHIYFITQKMAQVCLNYVSEPLSIVGGFTALSAFSKQYLEYRLSTDESMEGDDETYFNPRHSASAVSSDQMNYSEDMDKSEDGTEDTPTSSD